MMLPKTKLIYLTAALIFTVQGWSQVQQIDVYTGFEPKLAEVEKINDQPVIKDTFNLSQPLQYSINSTAVDVLYAPDTIAAARMKNEPLSKLHRFYLKAGFGNYLTPLVDFYVNSLRHRKDSYTFRYKHFSSQGNISDRGNPALSDNEFWGSYNHFFPQHTITLMADYHRNVVRYYGYDPAVDTLVIEDSTRQRFSRINFTGAFGSNYRTDSIKWNHSVGISFYHMSDLYRTTENSFGVTANVNKFTDAFAREFFGGDLSFRYLNYSNDSMPSNNAVFVNLSPYIELGGKKWNLKLGVDLSIAGDDSTEFNVYPAIDFRWNIFRQYIMLYTNISGKYERNSFLSLSQQNPFVMSTVGLRNMNEYVKVNAGVKGAFTPNISYNAGINFSVVNNFAYFVNDTLNFQRRGFDVVYDRTNIFNVFGELAYETGEKFRLTGKINYTVYTPQTLAEPWHRPYIDGTISARYNLRDKLIFTADLFFIGPQQGRTFVPDPVNPGQRMEQAVTLDGLVDINLGAEYRLTKMISFWLNVNNIAAQRYNRWYNYPSQQFNIIGGITLGI